MIKRIPKNTNTLPFLKDQDFEDEAGLLLAEFGKTHGQVIAPPIPVDEIVELYLGLSLEFKDMLSLFGVDDVHGALWVNKKLVGIDRRLDPTNRPAMLGRFRFTLAHEAGHWRLHRHRFLHHANQHALFAEGVDRPEYICRSSDREPIEYQADRFASCLLMPREMLKRAWHEWRKSMDPLYLSDLRTKGDNAETDEYLLENSIRPLAAKFQVSAAQMRIRTQDLGLLLNKREATLFG